ncbi:MAG: response regulator [Spirochaetia bacterium]|nr:response regulator [Spirochaetia bacterium]
MKVLIIDDSKIQQKLASIYLNSGEYTLITADSGSEGISKAGTDKPGLVILDVEMPGMDGLATLKILKSNPATSSIPVLMCSSIKRQEVINTAMGLGAAGFITKPHGFKNFTARVREIFNRDSV